MIIVSIFSSEEKFVIRLKHKIDLVVEKKFFRAYSLSQRTIYLFVQLFFSTTKLIYKEIFAESAQ